jgi:hypothetical protein
MLIDLKLLINLNILIIVKTLHLATRKYRLLISF